MTALTRGEPLTRTIFASGRSLESYSINIYLLDAHLASSLTSSVQETPAMPPPTITSAAISL